MSANVGRRLALVLTLAAATSSPVAAAGAVLPRCAGLAMSPAFPTDGKAWCGDVVLSPQTGRITGVVLFATADRGRTWRQVRAAGVTSTEGPSAPQVSPAYATDRRIFWATSAGVHMSVDDGETFEVVHPAARGSQVPEGRPTVFASGAGSAVVVAGPGEPDVSWLVQPPLVRPILGTPDDDQRFVVAGGPAATRPIFGIGWQLVPGTSVKRMAVYACAPDFTCAEPRAALPAPTDGWTTFFVDAWASPRYDTDRTLYLAVRGGPHFATTTLWKSVDDARTFVPLTPANALLAQTRPAGGPLVAMAIDEHDPRRMYLRIMTRGTGGTVAQERIFRTSDAGASWRLVAHGMIDQTQRWTGNVPWRPGAVTTGMVPAIYRSGNALVVNGVGDGKARTYCSTDDGRTWRTRC